MANGKWLLITLALVSSVGCSNEQLTADAGGGSDAFTPPARGCGWDDAARGFACGTSARPPMGDPDVVCTGDSCTYTNPDAMCFTQTCDYATGTLTTCSYRSGMCPCDQVEECGAP